jgi:hypothetical protein
VEYVIVSAQLSHTFRQNDYGGFLLCANVTPTIHRIHTLLATVLLCRASLTLRRHALDVTGAPEPSDVQYENMEHGGVDRFLRAALVAACSYSALAVGFVLISLATAMRYNLPKVCVSLTWLAVQD